jgi:FKBP-type peptidyl-prolyl cis-trans isomerase
VFAVGRGATLPAVDRAVEGQRAGNRILVFKRLVDGTGPVVKAGQTVVLQHSSAAWEPARGKDKADLFLSSHGDGGPLPVVIGRGNVIAGWDCALVGQRVGSRFLEVIPAKLAFGPHPPKGLAPGATVISVLDILAAA